MDKDPKTNDVAEALSYLSVSTKPEIKYRPMPDPLSVYVPLEALNEKTIDSVVSTVQQHNKEDWNHSKRTLVAFLLAINNRLNEIEKNEDTNKKFDEQTIQCAAKVREWLVEKDRYQNIKKIDWPDLQVRYEQMISDQSDGMARHYDVQEYQPYYELTIENVHRDILQSREYMTRFRNHGWEPKELKIYWNPQQLENLCPKSIPDDKQVEEDAKTQPLEEGEAKNEKQDDKAEETNVETNTETLPAHDPSDIDAVLALRQYPVSKRNFNCKIKFIHKGIERAVFDAPEHAQLIVLNFANERSPGGGYLRHAWAQEEIILFNSDGYRSLLDLKYGRMGGGYAIPEFGLAYVRDIRFFDQDTGKDRKTDMLVSACYCLQGSHQLYDNPTSTEKRIENDIEKFRAFISAAVANTNGDGSNTYLLLGPIGTGAFYNDVDEIGRVFRDVLLSTMMGSNGPVYNVFPHIWFVSTDKWKNDRFEEIFRDGGITLGSE